jgi:hypothetical protein
MSCLNRFYGYAEGSSDATITTKDTKGKKQIYMFSLCDLRGEIISDLFNWSLPGNRNPHFQNCTLVVSFTAVRAFGFGVVFKQIFNDYRLLNKTQKTLTSYRVHSMILKISSILASARSSIIRLIGVLGKPVYMIPLMPVKYGAGRR